MAQTDSDIKKQESRTRNFTEFLLYWSEWYAYVDVSGVDKRRAERKEYDETLKKIPELIKDSTYYANLIAQNAYVINNKYSLNQKPDMAYFMYELKSIYKDKNTDKKSDEYLLGKSLEQYEQTLKKLKLARYTIKVNKK